MVGLGETEAQVQETIEDLHKAGCDIITIGQYLQASSYEAPRQIFRHSRTVQVL